jgi:hypothetical protein
MNEINTVAGAHAREQCAATGDDQAEARSQAVRGRGGGHADDDARNQPKGTALEAFALDGGRPGVGLRHGISLLECLVRRW